MRTEVVPSRNHPPRPLPTRCRRRVPLLMSVGVLLVLLLAGCKSGGNVSTTPTATATATATPAPFSQMLLGHGMNKDANENITIVGQTTTFKPGDPFTYVVTVKPPFGVGSLTTSLLALNSPGGSKLGTWTDNITDPTWTQFSRSWTNIDKLMQPCPGAGSNFEIQMRRGDAVIASATFTYSGCDQVTSG